MAKRKFTLFEIIVGIATIVGFVAAVLANPEFRQWAGLEKSESFIPENTSIPTQLIQATQPNAECITPQELAMQKDWTDMGWADEKYCGLRVSISTSDELPTLWEAIGVKRIYQNDQDRLMPSGVWSIY